jgi:hypothetical protein
MDKHTSGLLAFFLSLVALSIGTLPLFEFMGFISNKGWFHLRIVVGGVMFGFWGWFLPIALGVVSFRLARRTQDIVAKIPIWVFSALAVVSGLAWLSLLIFMIYFFATANWA